MRTLIGGIVLVLGASCACASPPESYLPGGQVFLETSFSLSGARLALPVDLDQDGDLDILAAANGADQFVWYDNDGGQSATFTERVIASGIDAYAAYPVDIDGDHDLDIVGSGAINNTVLWLESDGATPPAFTQHVITTSENVPGPVHAGDVDGDGDMDLLAATRSYVRWYENNGGTPPTFTTRTVVATNNAGSVEAVDLDDDEDLDILYAETLGDHKIVWMESDGGDNPAFTARTIMQVSGRYPSMATTADLDADDDLDVVSPQQGPDQVFWYECDGAADPSFSEHIGAGSLDYPIYCGAADMNKDGHLDILSASFFDNTVAVLINNSDSPLTFTTYVLSDNVSGVRSVAGADIDADGDMDILSASSGDNKIRWFRNFAGDTTDAKNWRQFK